MVSGAISSGVTMTLSGTSSGTATTDAGGNYTFTGRSNGSYTITPSLAGYTFHPSSTAVKINGANITSINFTATATTYSISGTVSGDIQQGVTVTLSGNGSGKATTDASGNYSLTTLVNGSYTLTPSITGYTFSPTSQAVKINGADVSAINFTCSKDSGQALATLPTLATTSHAQVKVSSKKQGSVGPDFIGFSYEKSMLSKNLFRADNAPLIALFSKWGPGLLRIGGYSVDETTWEANGSGRTDGCTAPSDIDRLAGFLRATNWKVIYGLNATTSTPDLTAAEAAYAAQSLGDRLENFEIGNEPDIYQSNGLRPTTYTFTNFLADWDSYVTAIKAAVPDAVFSGPASAYNSSVYTIPFANDRGNEIEQLTQHYYRADGGLATSTIDFLLTPDTTLPPTLVALTTAAKNNNIAKGFRMTETNSFYNGGAPGISDAFGTALWIVEYCFTLAQNGVVGANFHGGGDIPAYTPIADDYSGNIVGVRAEYYGMLLFSMMGPGNVLEMSVSGSAQALFSYAVARSDGTTAIVLLNNSRTDVVAVTLNLPSSAKSAHALLLTAANLDTDNGFYFGDSMIQCDGSWSATTTYNVPITSSLAWVDVPASSAILIQTQ
jgi:hypothetical protein